MSDREGGEGWISGWMDSHQANEGGPTEEVGRGEDVG